MQFLPQEIHPLLADAKSTSGFTRIERQQSPQFKLLCAFASRWRGSQPSGFDVSTLQGKQNVAQIIDKVLLALPAERQDLLINKLLIWLAQLVKTAEIDEKWFDDAFRRLVDQVQKLDLNINDSAPPQQINLTKPKQQISIEKKYEIQESDDQVIQVESFDKITPKYLNCYKYQDCVNPEFFKFTKNELTKPQNVLNNAQYQAVHGKRIAKIEREVETRNSVHIRNASDTAPYHQRALSAPYFHGLQEAKQKAEIINLLEIGQNVQQNGRVIANLSKGQRDQLKNVIMSNDINLDAQSKINAYNEGRAKQKTIEINKTESKRYNNHIINNEKFENNYFHGQNNKKPTIFDNNNESQAIDQVNLNNYDEIVENQHDEDFTGLGLCNLNEAEIKARLNINDEGEQQEDEAKTKMAGYAFRKTIVNDMLQQVSIPMFDTKIKGLEYIKDEENYVAANTQDIEKQILAGGDHKFDPKVYQVCAVAKFVTDNNDLSIHSDSDEIIEDECFRGGLSDSECSENIQIEDNEPKLVKRSEVLKDLKETLKVIESAEIASSNAPTVIYGMEKKKGLVVKRERAQFDLDEQLRSKEAKKKEKPFKPKKFVSQTTKQFYNTKTGASLPVQAKINEILENQYNITVNKQQATKLLTEIDAQIKQDQELENTYENEIKIVTRKTEAAEPLKAAILLKEKESSAPKKILSSILFTENFNPETTPHQVIQDAQKYIEQVNKDLQKPFIYGSTNGMDSIKQRFYQEPENLTEADQPGMPLQKQTYLPVGAQIKEPGMSHNVVKYQQNSVFVNNFLQKMTDIQQFIGENTPVDNLAILASQKINQQHQQTKKQPVTHSQDQQSSLYDTKYFNSAKVFSNEPIIDQDAPIINLATPYQNPQNPEILAENLRKQNQFQRQIVPTKNLLAMQRATSSNIYYRKQLLDAGIRVVGGEPVKAENKPILSCFEGVSQSTGPDMAPRVLVKKGKKGKKERKAKRVKKERSDKLFSIYIFEF